MLAEYLLLGYLLQAVVWDVATARWAHALFALGNALALGYAVVAFIGLRASRADLLTRWRSPGTGRAVSRPTLPQRTAVVAGERLTDDVRRPVRRSA